MLRRWLARRLIIAALRLSRQTRTIPHPPPTPARGGWVARVPSVQNLSPI